MKKFPAYPLILSFFPLMFFLISSQDPLNPVVPLRTGALWILGGAALYVLFWIILRSPLRAALLAGLWLILLFSYDFVYELVRDASLNGWSFGRHRYLAPAWLVLMALVTFLSAVKIRPALRPARVVDVASLVLLLPMTAASVITGGWYLPLRAIGLIPPPRLEVTYIDVGNFGPDMPGLIGEAILLRSSEGKTVLIDGGYPNGRAAKYLADHAVTHLDMVVLSHAHDDHTGGLIEVFQTVPVDVFVYNGQSIDTPIFEDLQEAIRSAGVETRVVRAGDRLPFGSLVFDVLNPAVIYPDSFNNSSVVLRLLVGKVSFLFTGDTETLEELRLVKSGMELRTNILKLAHHGSSSSSHPEFIAAVSPEVAIYVTGLNNDDGFPHAVTLDTLRAAGVEVFGTDMYGTIVVRTNGKTYEVLPERAEELQD